MKTLWALVAAIACPALAYAQTATLRLTVVDPSNAVIVGARVEVRPAASTVPVPPAVASDARGDAVFALLEPGRYAIRVEAAGFETYDARDVRLRAGESRRTVKLAIAKLAETVLVGRDARERASDPRSDAFATVLGAAEIDELPDDPDQMEQVLKEMAGPGAVMRVNGFHGGRLPPKDQIAQIRFHRNMFAADVHEPGFISIDIITKPGLDAWRGSTSVGVRNDLLNARNAFAPVKGDERNERLAFSLNGPLWRKHTSLSLSVDGTNAFDSRTIVAALPSGYFADTIRKPNDALNFSARLEHGLSASQMLRVEAQRNHAFGDNLGVGDFDLTERAYSETRDSTVLRGSIAGSLRNSMFNELRVQWRSQDATLASRSHLPAIFVLNAFNAGGAQIDGTDRETATYVADDLDIASGRHALRAGFLFERSRYRSDVRRNAAGTFTFADLAAYAAGRPTTYTWNDGDPRVSIAQAQFGAYIQDDYRAAKSLTLSGGVRQEYQSTIGGLHAAPRGGVVWSPFRNGKTTVRAGGGVFFDWFDAQVYEQTVQLDGAHQRIETIVQPGYPEPVAAASAIVLPNGRVQLAEDLDQPILREAILGIERQLPGQVRLNAMLIRRRAASLLRGVNLNAPRPDGTRPDPTAGTITQIQSTAASSFDGFSVNLNFTKPERRIFVAANYMLSRSIDEADSPFALAANARDLAAERGPSPADARHRAMGFVNFPLFGRLTIGSSFRMQSALPYNITTGRDDNGDTISNDRPAGVTRNTGRGRYAIDIGARASWKIGFGGPATTPAGPQVHILRGGADANPLADTMSGGRTTRYSIELYAQAFNMLNRLNALNFSGVTTSPFFGRPTSAAPPRRVEVGARLNF